MPEPNLTEPLTTEERLQLESLLGNKILLTALRKVWAQDALYWLNAMKGAGLAPEPNVYVIVGAAARAQHAAEIENEIRRRAKKG